MLSRRGAGLRWIPLPKAEAPTEPTGETGYHPPAQGYAEHRYCKLNLRFFGVPPQNDNVYYFVLSSCADRRIALEGAV